MCTQTNIRIFAGDPFIHPGTVSMNSLTGSSTQKVYPLNTQETHNDQLVMGE